MLIKPGQLWLVLGLHRATAAPSVREESELPWKGDAAGDAARWGRSRKGKENDSSGCPRGKEGEMGRGKEIWPN